MTPTFELPSHIKTAQSLAHQITALESKIHHVRMERLNASDPEQEAFLKSKDPEAFIEKLSGDLALKRDSLVKDFIKLFKNRGLDRCKEIATRIKACHGEIDEKNPKYHNELWWEICVLITEYEMIVECSGFRKFAAVKQAPSDFERIQLSQAEEVKTCVESQIAELHSKIDIAQTRHDFDAPGIVNLLIKLESIKLALPAAESRLTSAKDFHEKLKRQASDFEKANPGLLEMIKIRENCAAEYKGETEISFSYVPRMGSYLEGTEIQKLIPQIAKNLSN